MKKLPSVGSKTDGDRPQDTPINCKSCPWLHCLVPGLQKEVKHVLYVATSCKRRRADAGSVPHLLVGGSASGHQNDVETSESSYRDEEQASHTHDSQSESAEVKENMPAEPEAEPEPAPNPKPEPEPVRRT